MKPLLLTLSGQRNDRTPFWFMRQAGRYLPEYRALRAKAGDFLTMCLTPELACEITLQPIRRFGMDAAILFADILLIAKALGQDLAFKEGEGPVLGPLDLGRLSDAASAAGALAPVYDAVRHVRAELPGTTALIGFAGAPWTVASYMIAGRGGHDFSAIRGRALKDPVWFQALIDKLVDATTLYLVEQVKAGAEALQVFDTWAGVLSAEEFDRWVIAPTRAIVSRVKAAAPVPIIGFPKGAGTRAMEYARATGIDAMGFDSSTPMDWIARHVRPLVAVQGNLDPLMVIEGGEAMERAARAILSHRDGLIFNLGHGIRPETPIAHVERLCAIIRSG